jgi:hypothetical protein
MGRVTPEVPAVKKKRVSILLPRGLSLEIESQVGRRALNTFFREAAQQELERRRVLESIPNETAGRNGARASSFAKAKS